MPCVETPGEGGAAYGLEKGRWAKDCSCTSVHSTGWSKQSGARDTLRQENKTGAKGHLPNVMSFLTSSQPWDGAPAPFLQRLRSGTEVRGRSSVCRADGTIQQVTTSVTDSLKTLSYNFLLQKEEMTRVGGLLELKEEITSRPSH